MKCFAILCIFDIWKDDACLLAALSAAEERS